MYVCIVLYCIVLYIVLYCIVCKYVCIRIMPHNIYRYNVFGGGAYQWYQNKLRWRGPRISLSDKFANACKRLCINFQVGTWHRFISWNFRCPTPKKKTDQSSASKNSSRCIFYQAMTPLKPFHPWSTVDISTINLHKSQSFHSHLRTLTIRHSLH
jgi:hypothetical protein